MAFIILFIKEKYNEWNHDNFINLNNLSNDIQKHKCS